jgi:nucleotide-binding universal stress UspA family protein
MRRVVVGVHGSLGSLQALRYAANEARDRDTPLVAIIAWLPPGGDLAERRYPSVGTGRRGLRRAMSRSVSRYCLAHAQCPVTAVPPSALMEETARGIHLWPLRHRALVPDGPGNWLGRP